jgi:pSer/pThr/pTyr-binding forkhead associated (FHA) protein
VVVTRHDTSPGLFNTKFRLNFGPSPFRSEEEGNLTELSIGRSSLCNMVLDDRTVSSVHSKLRSIDKNGEFFVQDAHSSNGTMVYLQGPLPLVNNQTVRLRMGRSTLALQVI